MKIMHVCKKYPPLLGGDATVVSHLRQQQRQNGHQTIVVTSNHGGPRPHEHIYKVGLKDTSRGLDSITPKRVVSLLMLLVRSFFILRRERPDVVHTHSVDLAFIMSWAARFYRIPLVHTFHIVTFYDAAQSLGRRASELWLAKKARPLVVTAPNVYDVKQLQKAGLTQAVLMPNGTDIDFWHAGKKVKHSNEPFTFITVGRLEHQKGYAHLLRATALLAAQQPSAPFRLVIVGEGSQEEPLKRLAHELGIDQLTSFVGKKSSVELRDLLATTDVLTLPSLYETTPLTLLEAWAAGLPVIATPVGILRDMPFNTAAVHLVPIGDETALSQAMCCVMADASLCSRLTKAGQKAVSQYTWPHIAEQAEKIYGAVL